MTTTIADIIKRGTRRIHRRVSMKRLQFSTGYESEWFDITKYVVSYGAIRSSYGDNVFLGSYQIDFTTLVVENARRAFNRENDADSLFFGFLTRQKTKFKIEYVFIDDDGVTEIEGLTYYGILYGEPRNNDDGKMRVSIAPFLKVFELYPAYGVEVTSGTTAALITRLVQKTQNGTRLFDRYFEGADDATRYQINPDALTVTSVSNPSIPEDKTVWEKIQDYSLIEDFFPAVNSDGNFVWNTKSDTGVVSWVFNGGASFDADYGVTISSIDEEVSGIENVWTRCTIEYQEGAFAVGEDTWTPGDNSDQDIYGERTYSKSLFDLNITQAQALASAIKERHKTAKRRWTITTPILPHLNLRDLVTINYTGEIPGQDSFTIGMSQLGVGRLGYGASGSIFLENQSAKIIEMSHDLDRHESKFVLMEV